MPVLRRPNHELEVQKDCGERHKVESDGTESDSPDFVHESANFDSVRRILHWIVSAVN